MAYTIEATGLVKTFGTTRVLDGLDLSVEAGQVFALLGPNGAGKTTTVRILTTLLSPDAGVARVAGFDVEEAADRRVSTYSGGMRRRLDLAMSLVRRPAVLFLDEPTTGLDPRSRRAVWEAVTSLADEGVTVLLTTQYLEEADRLADQ